MGTTTDRNNSGLEKIVESGVREGQQENYLVLSEEERAKGFVRPYRDTYTHLKCGGRTTMANAIAETYARNPTFCSRCKDHFDLKEWSDDKQDFVPAFVWDDGVGIGE